MPASGLTDVPLPTAVVMAFLRAHHARHGDPKIFDDFLAGRLITADEAAAIERRAIDALRRLRPEVDQRRIDHASLLREALSVRGAQAEIIARARFTEDRLLHALKTGVTQYVILGAGLDTFALRRPDLQDQLEVFEIDRPAFQGSKRARLDAAGLACPANLHLLAADFEHDSLADILLRSAYQSDRKAFFSCLGVSFYLSAETVFDLLRAIRRVAAPGSLLALDYLDLEAFDPAKASPQIKEIMDAVRGVGEPMRSGFDPHRLPADLRQLGFRIVEAVDPDTQHFHFVAAEVVKA